MNLRFFHRPPGILGRYFRGDCLDGTHRHQSAPGGAISRHCTAYCQRVLYLSGANAETVQKAVIVPLGEAINGVEDMIYMTSTASNTGDASINIYFKQVPTRTWRR